MGQQVNISSKVKSPSESDYTVCNNYNLKILLYARPKRSDALPRYAVAANDKKQML